MTRLKYLFVCSLLVSGCADHRNQYEKNRIEAGTLRDQACDMKRKFRTKREYQWDHYGRARCAKAKNNAW